jgi:hypothetical protein
VPQSRHYSSPFPQTLPEWLATIPIS